MTNFPAIVNFRIMSSLLPGVAGRGQPPRPPIHTKSFASTKMPCSRSGHSKPSPGPPQLVSSVPAASNSSTGGAAFARCAWGIDCGTCSTQMWSFLSTEIDVTSPSTQLFGNGRPFRIELERRRLQLLPPEDRGEEEGGEGKEWGKGR